MLRVEPRLHNTYRPSIKQDEKKKSATQIELEEQKSSNGQLNKSKGLQYVETRQTTAQLNGPLKPTAKQTITVINPEDKIQKQATTISQSSAQNFNSNSISVSASTVKQHSQISAQTTVESEKTAPVQQKSQLTRSPKVNIAQIIKDFKNTANAIGTPEDTYQEVNGYLNLVETQVKKDEPNVKLVQSNLRNASVILDKYISDTLNKDSKVVENWVEAVFLQQVNYKYNEGEINKDLMVKIPGENKEKSQETQQIQQTQTTEASKTASVDENLKTLLTQAKNTQDNTQALEIYNQALTRCDEIEDKDSKGKVHFEIAQVYNNEDDTDNAIDNYKKAINTTQDLNVKTKAHYSMAQIYDEQRNYPQAINNYVDAIAYAGENNNLKAQTGSLTKIANIYADNYDGSAFKIYDEAKNVADITQDAKLKGYVSVNTAKACEKFDKKHSAFNFYTDAVKNYQEANLKDKVAVNLKRAGEVIKDVKPQTAQDCFKKAMTIAVNLKDEKLIKDINSNFLYS